MRKRSVRRIHHAVQVAYKTPLALGFIFFGVCNGGTGGDGCPALHEGLAASGFLGDICNAINRNDVFFSVGLD